VDLPVSTLGTVTTVGGRYCTYIDDWTDRLLRQQRRPDRIVVVDNGADNPARVKTAAERLGAHLIVMPWTVNYGRARNIGIEACDTEWVHHADVDDLLYPHAIAETYGYMPDADVIAWGWDLAHGYRELKRIYRPTRGPSTLTSPGPASGLSPFRRTLWEQHPYRDDLPSAWDTGLWRGFGHLNARFVPTRRTMFGYRYHNDSVFHARQASGDRTVGRRLAELAAHHPDETMVVVPWRDQGCPHRQAAWGWCKARWLDYGYPVVEADCDGPWNKPAALNETIADLDCRTLIVADADVMIPKADIDRAVRQSWTHPWVVPHGDVHRFGEQATARIYQGAEPTPDRVMKPYRGLPGGGLFVISRQQWHEAGGMDRRFVGWGAEDEAFAQAADSLLGPHLRGTVDLWHLYHPPGLRTSHPDWQANADLWRHYKTAAGRGREAMKTLIGGRPCSTRSD
jgi:glycosyltransferase involved in cell wall biosynthesis